MQVFALQTPVVACCNGARREGNAVPLQRMHQLLRHHGVAACRHYGTGHDAQALAIAHCRASGIAREGRADHGEHGVGFCCYVAAAQGIAVHGGVVVGGHVDGGDDVLRQYAAQGGSERNLLNLSNGLHARFNDLLCNNDGQCFWVVAFNALCAFGQGVGLSHVAAGAQELSSASVLILRNALSSSNVTSVTKRVLYHSSTLRPPLSK